MKKTFLFFCAITYLNLLVGCSPRSDEHANISPSDSFDPRAHGNKTCLPRKIIANMRTRATSLDPAKITIYIDNAIAMAAFGQLTTLDQYDNPRPYIAKNWQVSNDGLEYTFALDQSSRFSDGRPVTAYDVVHSLSRLFAEDIDPKVGTYLFGNSILGVDEFKRGFTKHLTGIRVLDNMTVRIILKKPRSNLLTMLSMGSASIFPADAVKHPLKPSDFVSSGPYVIKSFSPKRVSLATNPFFPAAAVLPDVTFLYDEADICTILKSGRFDFLDMGPIENAACIAHDYVVSRFPSANIWFISFGKSISPTDRRTIAACANRRRYLTLLEKRNSTARPLQGLFPSLPPPNIDTIAPCASQSKCTLTTPRSATLIVNKRHRPTEPLRSLFEDIKNLSIVIHEVDDATHHALRDSGEYDMALFEFTGTFSDPTFYSSLFYSKGSIINSGYHNYQYDQLSEKLTMSETADAQMKTIREINKIIENDPPAIFLKQHDNVEFIRSSLHLKREGWNNRYFFTYRNSNNEIDCR